MSWKMLTKQCLTDWYQNSLKHTKRKRPYSEKDFRPLTGTPREPQLHIVLGGSQSREGFSEK